MTNKNKKTDTITESIKTGGSLDFSGAMGYASRGSGVDFEGRLRGLGDRTIIETGVRILHPENVDIGADAFVGHGAHLDGYHKGHIKVGEESWIGQDVFINGAGGVDIGRAVGIGPRVIILTSEHDLDRIDIPVLHSPLTFAPVTIDDGADIGAGAVILPGCAIGRNAVVGAGAVVTKNVAPCSIAAGNPARVIRQRR